MHDAAEPPELRATLYDGVTPLQLVQGPLPARPDPDAYCVRVGYGACVCPVCGEFAEAHLGDWSELTYDWPHRPHLRVLCDGRRVKL